MHHMSSEKWSKREESMKCQNLFPGKKIRKYFKMSSVKVLPSMLSINGSLFFIFYRTSTDTDCVFEFKWETKLACKVKKYVLHF